MITLGGATATLPKSLREYRDAWKAFMVVHHLETLEREVRATTFSWKVADKPALFTCLEANADHIEQLHIGTVNGRFIASAVLHEPYEAMPIMKILERRQGSADPLGLDSIDYITDDRDRVFRMLQDAGASVELQSNDLHDWLSLRFGEHLQYEAKFNDSLVLKVSIEELRIAEQRLLQI